MSTSPLRLEAPIDEIVRLGAALSAHAALLHDGRTRATALPDALGSDILIDEAPEASLNVLEFANVELLEWMIILLISAEIVFSVVAFLRH
ncbi:MAG: hypothetical protein FJ292_01805 [Planctomycetes bacterium]|nr:hypothetical protein [Planctomycetota bacterium]